MNYLRLNCDKDTVETSTPDPDDRWDRASTESTWTVHGLSLHDNDSYDAVNNYLGAKPGYRVWVLYAVYSTGDSFGNDDGYNLEFINVFDNREDATAARDSLENSSSYKLSNGVEINMGWKPWDGYFECLNYMEVTSFEVDSTGSRKYY